MPETDACDYCGKMREDLMPSFWSGRTRWFCDVECLGRFKAVAIGIQYSAEVIEGCPGTAKDFYEKMQTRMER